MTPNDMIASALLKALANPDRLVTLCHLAAGERTVTELGALLDLRQPTLSQHLARLRAEDLARPAATARTSTTRSPARRRRA